MVLKPDWSYNKLNQLGFVGRGKSKHRPRNAPFLYGGKYPFIQTAEIKAADLHIYEYNQTYNEEGLAQSKLWEPGTLCITIAANIAETAVLGIRGCFPDSIVGFVAHSEKADTYFVKYYIDTIKLRMQNVSKGTTQDNLSLDKLLRFDILTPPLPAQQKIATILSTYDRLIENNNRRIKILEEMARLIYREWFVNYRFPGHEKVKMVDSVIGMIPEGWKVISILQSPYFVFMGENIKPYQGIKTYYATADVSGIDIVSKGIDYSYKDKPSRAQKQPVLYSVWFARMQDTYKVLAFTKANINVTQSCMLSSGFAGFRSLDEGSFAFLYFNINSVDFHRNKDMYCTGATQRSLTNEGLARIMLLIPPRDIVYRFGAIAQPFIDEILILQRKNLILQHSRDLLLPKLISRELDVSELDIDTGGGAA